jgi:hypothetical protein
LRLSLPLSASLVVAALGVAAVGVARAAQGVAAPVDAAKVRSLRAAVDHYRTVTWVYEHAARRGLTGTSFSYRRSSDAAYLEWTVDSWQRHAYRAREAALRELRQRLGVVLPHGPGVHASLYRRLRYSRALVLKLETIYPGHTARRMLAGARQPGGGQLVEVWELRAARSMLAVSQHATRLMLIGPRWLTAAFLCIHRYEAAWNANTGNGYYGGLQMDWGFMHRYGRPYLRRWGSADHWPAWAQLAASEQAYQSGRGFWPWPNTARACGLL